MEKELNESCHPVFESVAGEKKLRIRYDNVKLGEFERNVIMENKCGSFLDMQCVYNGNIMDVFYSCEDYRAISDVISEEIYDATELFTVINAVLHAVKDCLDYLIAPEELCLLPKYIYYSDKRKKAELLYMPGYKSGREVGEQIAGIAGFVFEAEGGEISVKESAEKYIKKILDKDYGLSELIQITEEFIRSERILKMPEIYANSMNEREDFYIKEDTEEYPIKGKIINIDINAVKSCVRSMIKEFIS